MLNENFKSDKNYSFLTIYVFFNKSFNFKINYIADKLIAKSFLQII